MTTSHVLRLGAPIPGEHTHRRAYHADRRPFWACSDVGWAPCAGHGVRPAPTPGPARRSLPAETGCPHGHPVERSRIYITASGWRQKACLECRAEHERERVRIGPGRSGRGKGWREAA